ncbi:PAS domain S-box protein [Loktanella sp. 5RATIMAR09]|uniref:hybrid sensor histidine kinase/response regulator n=1 Tax=Loktanella sp. 5RATIMAR09 TaxID=1225655 RepID=UPI0006EB961C|nr:PAS domain S-box protein [Loktanella sp. 5RATIMAR09]
MKTTNESLYQSHPDPMWIYDLDTLRFLSVNEAAVAKYGYSRDEFLAMTIAEIRPSEDKPALVANVAAVTPGRNEAGVWRHRLKSGEIIHVDITSHIIDHEGRNARLTAARDVTERVEAERALAQAKRMLEIAGHSAKFGAWRYDVRRDRLKWSAESARIHGEPDGFSPTVDSGIAYYVPEHRERVTALFQACRDHGTPWSETFQIITAQGRKLWVRTTGEAEYDTAGDIIFVQGAIQDISELVTVRERAEEAERLLEIAGRVVKLGGWRVDLQSDEVTWTDGTAAIHELPPGTAPTLKGGIDYFAPEERDAAWKAFQECVQHGTTFDDVREVITAKGNRVQVRSIGVAVRNDMGQIVAVQGAMQDITDLTSARRKADELSMRLAETLESIGDAFFVIDHGWRYTYLNSKAEELMRRSRSELIGCHVMEAFPDLEGSNAEMEYALAFDTGRTVRFEQFFAPFNRTFRISAHPIPEGLAVYFSDITEERRRTEQLRLLEGAVSKINDIVLITDAKPDEAGNTTITFVNDAFERITGFTREEAIGRTPHFLQGPKTQRSELDRIRHAMETQSPVRAEMVNYTKSGQEYWLALDIVPLSNEAGDVTHFVSVQREITDRRRAEETLRMSEARFRLIAEATESTVWDWDIIAGRWWWSDGMALQFGHHPETDAKEPTLWRENVHQDDVVRIEESFEKLLLGEINAAHERYRFRRADGTWAHVEDHAYPIRDSEGRIIRIIGSMADISDRLGMEERLRQSQKLEAMGQLTGGVAHDFNNLLTIIMGNTEMILDSIEEESPLRRFAGATAAATDRAAELTNRLLSFSRKQMLQPRVLDVNSVITGFEDMLRRTLGEGTDIEIHLGDEIWPSEIDPAQIEAALLNLAINARDAMPSGGSLIIETANVVADDVLVANESDLPAGHYIVIAVSDTGHGIPKDQINQVFQPFFTTKAVGKGTGLGLSMVHGFVKQTGGHIQIYSEVNEGTTVKLYFPRSFGDHEEERKTSHERSLQGGQETILVIDDDVLILQQVMAQLTALGYRVVTASAGPSALEILRTESDIDLLLTDVILPGGMNGRQIADAALAIYPSLKILYSSGYSENAIMPDGRLEADVNFLGKPYRRTELAAMVRKALDT